MKKIDVNSIPVSTHIFGREIITKIDEPHVRMQGKFGEARIGPNEIAVVTECSTGKITPEEIKLTYLHELIHFILNFTGYDRVIDEGKKIEEEQFVELLASGFYQYLKNVKY